MSATASQNRIQTYHSSHNEDISLIDLWLIILRRKWLVAAVTALVLLLGATFAWMHTENYEYRTNVDLARIYSYKKESQGFDLVNSMPGTKSLLENFLIPAQRKDMTDQNVSVPSVQVIERGSKKSLILASKASQEKQDLIGTLHKSIVQALSEHQAQSLEESISRQVIPLQVNMDMLQEEVDLLEEQLQTLSNRSGDGESIRSLIDARQMSDLRRELAQARTDRAEAQSAVQTIREASHNSRINFLASASAEPVGMSTQLTLVFALVLGLILGVITVFGYEFCQRSRQALKQNNA